MSRLVTATDHKGEDEATVGLGSETGRTPIIFQHCTFHGGPIFGRARAPPGGDAEPDKRPGQELQSIANQANQTGHGNNNHRDFARAAVPRPRPRQHPQLLLSPRDGAVFTRAGAKITKVTKFHVYTGCRYLKGVEDFDEHDRRQCSVSALCKTCLDDEAKEDPPESRDELDDVNM